MKNTRDVPRAHTFHQVDPIATITAQDHVEDWDYEFNSILEYRSYFGLLMFLAENLDKLRIIKKEDYYGRNI